ncbi:hypothetical protein DVH24_009356 [Malus domestica]|uniref:Uncharacterized protein n=1 Tax=Malus domestica TaxID=3750 RepID=A0A498ITN1_MALDO|nr:hypothetical protein DVH24_009356 [Malus domestica]
MLRSTPLGARRICWHTFGQGLALIPNCHFPARVPTTSQARLYRSMILSTLGPDHTLANFTMGHPSWDCSRANSLNFEVPMKPETSELLKGLVLGIDGNIHIRLTGSTPLGNVRCYN